jgi:hypothetical protein
MHTPLEYGVELARCIANEVQGESDEDFKRWSQFPNDLPMMDS